MGYLELMWSLGHWALFRPKSREQVRHHNFFAKMVAFDSIYKNCCVEDQNYFNEIQGCCEALRAVRGNEGCSLTRVLKCADTLGLLIILVLQGSTLNYFLINRMEGNGNGWYFWFLADFAVLIVMMTAVFLARRHHAHCRLQASSRSTSTTPATQEDQSCKWLGLFPFSYISWFLYSALLIAKIILLIQMDIATNIPSEAWYGSTFLTLVIGCAAIVFTLLVDSHHEAATDSPQQAFIIYMISYSSLEILDAVAFLGLLFPSQCNPQYRSRVEDLVLGLTCCALLLPTLALYKLAQSDFGKSARPLGLKLLYRVVYLLIINTPFLVIRMYLWTYFNEDVSVFLLKNVILSYVHLRSFIPECREWIANLRKLRDSLLHEERSFDGLPTVESATDRRENTTIELNEHDKQKAP